jgi:hypothetical protein
MQYDSMLDIPNYLTTKGERAEYLYGANNPHTDTYDCAVPAKWVHYANNRLPDAELRDADASKSDIARHVVTVYYKDNSVRIMPITDTGLLALATLATYADC